MALLIYVSTRSTTCSRVSASLPAYHQKMFLAKLLRCELPSTTTAHLLSMTIVHLPSPHTQPPFKKLHYYFYHTSLGFETILPRERKKDRFRVISSRKLLTPVYLVSPTRYESPRFLVVRLASQTSCYKPPTKPTLSEGRAKICVGLIEHLVGRVRKAGQPTSFSQKLILLYVEAITLYTNHMFSCETQLVGKHRLP